MSGNVIPVIQFAFYAFIVSIPFETASLELVSAVGTLPMMIGIAFAGTALLQPRICFNPPPGAFWCFAGYVLVYLILGTTQGGANAGPMLSRLFTLIQLLVLMWISYNLLKYPEIRKNALLGLVASCTIVSVLQILGVATASAGQGRSSVFADNANTVGATLALGLIALVGITYGRRMVEKRMALVAWTLFPVIGIALMKTGSRGALLGLVSGLALLIMKDGRLGMKLRVGVVAVLAIGFLVWAAVTDESMRVRLENTMYKGDVAKRDRIFPEAWAMFLEKPVLGWGPFYNGAELGYRLGRRARDAHNLYLSVLTETGLLGSIPFLAGLWLSLSSAWRARSGREGSLPMAMLVCLLIINMSATWHNRKLFWLTMAYVLASAWSVREASRHVPLRLPDPLNFKGPGSGAFAAFSQPTNGVAGTTSARQQGPA